MAVNAPCKKFTTIVPRRVAYQYFVSDNLIVKYLANSFLSASLLFFSAMSYPASAVTVRFTSLPGDGRLSTFGPSNSGCGISSWTNARLQTNGDADYTSKTRTFFAGSGCFGFNSIGVSRGFLAFDTSSIPSSAVITSAKVGVYITGKANSNDGKDFIALVQGLQQSTTVLGPADMTLAGSSLTGAVEGAARVDVTSIPVGAYQAWTLNTAGLSWIAKDGQTKLALREGHDLLDFLPDPLLGKGTFISAALSESGASQAPYLEVTYTASGTGSGSPGATPSDTTGPSVSLTTPGMNQSLSGNAVLSATATDASGVAAVTFRVDGSPVGAEDTVAPYTLTWDSDTVPNGSHTVTAQARDKAGNTSLSASIPVLVSNAVASNATISVNPSITHQKISGWEATAEAGQATSNYSLYRDEVLREAVNDLGLNRIRLEWKNSSGTAIDYATLDRDVTTVVNPMRQLVQARGEKLVINLCYVGFNNNGNTYRTNPSAYASATVAVFKHLRDKFGWTPDYYEVILEPDAGGMGWTGTHVANNLASAGNALANAGFTPKFVASSTTSGPNARNYFDAVLANSTALKYLTQISYHRYVNADDKILSQIAARGSSHNKETAMLEWIGATDKTLHTDLKIGNNSAWQQFTLAYPTSDNGAQYYYIDNSNPSNPQVHIGQRTKRLRQYFKFIRTGAVRLEASTANSNFDPVVFRNPNGKYVVVVQAATGGSFTIAGVPPGKYGLKYTTSSQYDVDMADVTITTGQALKGSIPASGVITLYGK
jgi:O-glycosyl hydrolase